MHRGEAGLWQKPGTGRVVLHAAPPIAAEIAVAILTFDKAARGRHKCRWVGRCGGMRMRARHRHMWRLPRRTTIVAEFDGTPNGIKRDDTAKNTGRITAVGPGRPRADRHGAPKR